MQSFTTVDEYIQSFPKDVQKVLASVRDTIKEELPHAKETMSYKMPSYTLGGETIIYFAGWKEHVSLYPFTPEMLVALPELRAYKSGKGTVQFSFDQEIPLNLIRKIVQFRLNEAE